MINISAALAAHLNAEVSLIALCWRISRRDGVLLGFTTHDRELRLDGVTYAPTPSFQPSQIRSGDAFAVDGLDVEGVITSSMIREEDLNAGRFDDALVDVFLLNWAAPEDGTLPLRSGRLGDISRDDGQFRAELRGRKQDLQQPIGGVYSPECRAQLGDKKCRVDLRYFTRVGKVMQVFSDNQFSVDTSEANDWFHYGRLTWLTGKNAGLRTEIKMDQAQIVTLVENMPHPINVDDLFEAHAGCDKRFETCKTKFDNVENFRGEPHVPGIDSVLDYPGLG